MNNPKYLGYWNIVKNESKKEATIYIYGVIGGLDFDTWTFINTGDKFVKEFNALDSEIDTVHVHINSPGGSVFEGLPIYNTLKNSNKTIYTYVDGIAYSMAAMIALAGEKVHGNKNSLFMVHNASTVAWGNAKQMMEEATILEKYDKSLGTIIEDKLDISEEEVSEKYLNYTDNFFTAKEAFDKGFFDVILDKTSEDVPEDVSKMSPTDLLKHYSKMNYEKDSGAPKQKPMKNTYTQIEAAINDTFAEGETENGIILSEAQAGLVEAQLGQLQNQLDAEKQKTATEAAKVKAEEEKATKALETINSVLGLEGDVKKTNLEEGVTALQEKITALSDAPGATHTTTPEDPDPQQGMPDYVDLNSSIYTQHKK